ncbi:hypothetical protein COCSUDRAFT_40869 [Coccomyxa subellipsoidea C-169]|uniref:START domain-containing protein n=1 Tax=Coccomyxa subellipsoidea (strain C-169) TaxID=574566 RepID=I0Z1G5_COCSC|nr:hypothetical protein COCSUDRAFT_40869 [Coccomyxa subellipsoidea C-169]EIE24484.1 hypothetical protein COCSUDRAFT_40869 [Coccomyxa subellipsoidea C-169]|eukprot:XP_005649028.1 hypothetical protein COCSUDRAFT_40869 [Coccomyxa subellipsoidea C-169]
MPSPLSAVFLSMVTSMLAANEVDLIWEEAITDVKSYADRLLAEADGLFGSAASDWDVVGDYDHGLRVYSRPIKGSKLLLVRSVVEVEKSAKDLFSLLTSAEGSDIIDDSTMHDPPVEILQWDDRAEVGYSKTIQSKFPFPKRSFVKASFFDTANTQVATKSILYQALPPGGDGLTRAFNSFALRTVALGPDRCRLEIVDFFDMRGWFPTWIANKFHKDMFCQKLHKRLWQHLGMESVPSSAAVTAA